jgi:hypothetical protein
VTCASDQRLRSHKAFKVIEAVSSVCVRISYRRFHMKRARIRMSFSDPFLLLAQQRLTGAPSRPTKRYRRLAIDLDRFTLQALDEHNSARADLDKPARGEGGRAHGPAGRPRFQLIGREMEL